MALVREGVENLTIGAALTYSGGQVKELGEVAGDTFILVIPEWGILRALTPVPVSIYYLVAFTGIAFVGLIVVICLFWASHTLLSVEPRCVLGAGLALLLD